VVLVTPAVDVVPRHELATWRIDAFILGGARLHGDRLQLDLSYTGGCAEHSFAIGAQAPTTEREGHVEVSLVVGHDAHGDSCKAIVREQLDVGLEPVLDRCRRLVTDDDAAVQLVIGPHRLRRPLSSPPRTRPT
jgi:hypothetical protein